MAIGWMFNTGIYQKMLKDVTASTELRAHFEEAFWVPDKKRTSSVLTMNHLLVVFLIHVVVLKVSIAIFLCEIKVGRKKAPPSPRPSMYGNTIRGPTVLDRDRSNKPGRRTRTEVFKRPETVVQKSRINTQK